MNHIALRIQDLSAYESFLERVFSYSVRERIHSTAGRFDSVFLERQGFGSIELIHNWDEPSIRRGRTLAHFGFSVEDLDDVRKRAGTLGLTILEESRLPSGLRQMYIQDPEGTPIEINECP